MIQTAADYSHDLFVTSDLIKFTHKNYKRLAVTLLITSFVLYWLKMPRQKKTILGGLSYVITRIISFSVILKILLLAAPNEHSTFHEYYVELIKFFYKLIGIFSNGIDYEKHYIGLTFPLVIAYGALFYFLSKHKTFRMNVYIFGLFLYFVEIPVTSSIEEHNTNVFYFQDNHKARFQFTFILRCCIVITILYYFMQFLIKGLKSVLIFALKLVIATFFSMILMYFFIGDHTPFNDWNKLKASL